MPMPARIIVAALVVLGVIGIATATTYPTETIAVATPDGGSLSVAPVPQIVSLAAGSARTCFGVTSADGGTASMGIPPGACRMNCTVSACAASAAVTTCSSSAAMVPDGLRFNERQPEQIKFATMTPTPDAGSSDATVIYLGAESSSGCCACTPLQ